MYKIKDELERHKGLESNLNIRINEINDKIDLLKREKVTLMDELKEINKVKRAIEALE